ncbi:tubulin polyglutamylase complex subunit 1 [Trichomycterus rosablanca]|uniref:tubulin polyglutamylase complex subunit 1 n=1 Tax=Trichomycterus rosablanca TaxID=2290929 RepID=UPI002F357F8B
MAEKRRSGVAADSKCVKAESDEEFLGQAGVGALLQGALLKLLELRPEDPITFLSEHFSNEAVESEADAGGDGEAGCDGGGDGEGGGDGKIQEVLDEQQQLGRALWHLSLAHHSHRSAFNINIRSAYDLLCQCGPGRRAPGGIRGRLYNETLRCVCSDAGLSSTTSASLLHRLHCHDYESVPFELFRQSVLSCAAFSEYVQRARRLYTNVARCPEEPADRALCSAVLDALGEALDTSHGPDATRFLQASAKISPAKLAQAMAEARIGNREQEGPRMDMCEFEAAAAALFIARLRVVS